MKMYSFSPLNIFIIFNQDKYWNLYSLYFIFLPSYNHLPLPHYYSLTIHIAKRKNFLRFTQRSPSRAVVTPGGIWKEGSIRGQSTTSLWWIKTRIATNILHRTWEQPLIRQLSGAKFQKECEKPSSQSPCSGKTPEFYAVLPWESPLAVVLQQAAGL